MKKGIVSVRALSHKNLNHVFREGDEVNDTEVFNFDELVKAGKIKFDAPKVKAKAEPTTAKKEEKTSNK